MRLHGLGDLVVEVAPDVPYELGSFIVRFVRSRHPFDGELSCDHLDGLCPSAYRCGQVWGIRIEVGGTSLYHQGSVNLDDDELGREPVDVFLAGVAGRGVTPRYWERILPRLDPRIVVPTHYDDFFTPLGQRASLIRRVDLESVPEEISAVSADARVAALPRIDLGGII